MQVQISGWEFETKLKCAVRVGVVKIGWELRGEGQVDWCGNERVGVVCKWVSEKREPYIRFKTLYIYIYMHRTDPYVSLGL